MSLHPHVEYAHRLVEARQRFSKGEALESDLQFLADHAAAKAAKAAKDVERINQALNARREARAAAIKDKVEAARKKIEDKVREIVDSCPEIFESFHTRRYGLVLQKEDDTTKWPKGYSVLWTPVNATMTIVAKPEKTTKTTKKTEETPAGTLKVPSLNVVK